MTKAHFTLLDRTGISLIDTKKSTRKESARVQKKTATKERWKRDVEEEHCVHEF